MVQLTAHAAALASFGVAASWCWLGFFVTATSPGASHGRGGSQISGGSAIHDSAADVYRLSSVVCAL